MELPAVPTGDYRLTVRFTPEADGPGELLLCLPVGDTRALVRAGGEKCALRLDLADRAEADEAARFIPYFAKRRDFEVSVDVSTSGNTARIVASVPDNPPLAWTGDVRRLAPPAACPVGAGRLAVGHRGLAMEVESTRVRVPDGGMRVLRGLPGAVDAAEEARIARWTMDDPVSGTRMRSSGAGVRGLLQGSPQVAARPALLGRGAMRLDGSYAGFQASETPLTNYGVHPERTISFWFMPDAAANARDQRQYLYSEGGDERGFDIYVANGVLWAGGWDDAAKWKGTWLRAWNVTPGRWHHVALVLESYERDRDKALALFLDGNEADAGFGTCIASHGPMVFGAMARAIRAGNDGLSDAAIRPFVGLLDQVEIWNGALDYQALHILAGAQY